jgi:hypothetical protein
MYFCSLLTHCCSVTDEILHSSQMTGKISVLQASIHGCNLMHVESVAEAFHSRNVLRTVYDSKHLRSDCGNLKFKNDLHITFIVQFK